MKLVEFGSPLRQPQDDFSRWVSDCFRAIERASLEDIEAVVQEYSVTGTLTESRTFNAGTADVAAIRNVLATLITDIKKQGMKRAYAD